MKQFYLFLILLFSFNLSSAQSEELIGQWSLDAIFDYDVLLENPIQPIIIDFISDGNEIIINDICGEIYSSQYTASSTENNITITSSGSFSMSCSEDNQGFQGATYSLLGYDTGEPKILSYSFSQDGDISILTLEFSIIINDIPEGVTGYFTKVGASNVDINGEWFLQHINTDGVQHDDYSSISIELLENQELNIYDFMGETGCDGYVGEFSIIDNNTISSNGITRLASCEPDAYGLYADKYYDILESQYQTSSPKYLNYTITGTGIDETLIISNKFGDFVVYGRENPTTTIFKTWYSYSTETVDGIIYPSPTDTATFEISPTTYDVVFGLEAFGNGGCNEFFAYHNIYDSNENEFDISIFDQTFIDCSEDNFYEPTYFSVLGSQTNGPFSYELQDDGNTLVLTNDIGEILTFGEQAPPANMLGEWFLYYVVVDGIQTDKPDGTLPNIEFTTTPDSDGFYYGGIVACTGYGGSYHYNPQQTFDAVYLNTTLGNPCDTAEENTFEDLYFNFVLNNPDDNATELDYEILGTGDDATLVVTNLLNGNQAFYGRQSLSIDDNEFNSSKISLIKNPVSNSLDLSTTQNLIGSNYEIFSITGQRIANGLLFSNSINVIQLHSGLYFLKVSKDENVFETVKFIKE